MQRISALWQASPNKIVGALVALSLAAMMAVASGASFTSTSANTGNIVTAGILSHGNSKANAFVLDVDALKPGQSQSGTVDITNTGDVAGVFSLSKDNVVDSDLANPLSENLDLVVADIGTPTVPGAAVGQVQRQARRHARERHGHAERRRRASLPLHRHVPGRRRPLQRDHRR